MLYILKSQVQIFRYPLRGVLNELAFKMDHFCLVKRLLTELDTSAFHVDDGAILALLFSMCEIYLVLSLLFLDGHVRDKFTTWFVL